MATVRLPKTAQEVFDIVVRGAYAQRFARAMRKVDGSMVCVYRSPKGLACHAGQLLPDAVAQRYTCYAWCDLQYRGIVSHQHGDLIALLQEAHDDSSSAKSCAWRTYEVGCAFGLAWPSDVPTPDQLFAA